MFFFQTLLILPPCARLYQSDFECQRKIDMNDGPVIFIEYSCQHGYLMNNRIAFDRQHQFCSFLSHQSTWSCIYSSKHWNVWGFFITWSPFDRFGHADCFIAKTWEDLEQKCELLCWICTGALVFHHPFPPCLTWLLCQFEVMYRAASSHTES